MAKTSDALAILNRRMGGDAELRRLVERENLNARIAQMIHDARTAAGLSQAQLAKRIGTQQSAIARLEDADYEGHSLSMLQKIATALGTRLEIKLHAPKANRTQTAKPTPSKATAKKTGHASKSKAAKNAVSNKTSKTPAGSKK